MADAANHRLNLWAARASVTVAVSLILLKIWALWMTGALSVMASLADSSLDLVMSTGAMLALAYAARPPDEDHAFGHTSAEDLTALAQAVVLVIAAVLLIASAVERFFGAAHDGLASEGVGIIAMAISMGMTAALVAFQGHVARKTKNRVVSADRLHYLADLVPQLGAIVALLASRLWGIWQIDALVALLAAAVLARGALSIGKGAWDALMDRRADPEVLAGIAAIADDFPGVLGWHDLKTRTAGSKIFVNLHIELDGDQSLREAHAIGADLRQAILRAYPQTDVMIHKDVIRET